MTGQWSRLLVPLIDLDNGRFPVIGGFLQRRGGTVRHDAVAWAYARAASARGVDIVEDCEVTGFRQGGAGLRGVETTRGFVGAGKVLLAVAGHSSTLAAMAGFRLPIETHVLQAFVTESLKPLIDVVVTYGAGHFYVSQSDKGGLVFGGHLDGYNSYAQRGNLPVVMDVLAAGATLMPALSRIRVLRQWGGVMDMTMDGNPIISTTPVAGLVLNGGGAMAGSRPFRRAASPRRTSSPPGSRIPSPSTSALVAFGRGTPSTSGASAPIPGRIEAHTECCASPVLSAGFATRSSSAIAATRRWRVHGRMPAKRPSSATSMPGKTRRGATRSGGSMSAAAGRRSASCAIR